MAREFQMYLPLSWGRWVKSYLLSHHWRALPKKSNAAIFRITVTALPHMVLFVLHLPSPPALLCWLTRRPSDHRLAPIWNAPPWRKTYSLRFSHIKQSWISRRRSWFLGGMYENRARSGFHAEDCLRQHSITACFQLLISAPPACSSNALEPQPQGSNPLPKERKGQILCKSAEKASFTRW